MGKQVNFFMMPKDLAVFGEYLRQNGGDDVKILPEKFRSPKMLIVPNVTIDDDQLGLCITKSSYMSQIVIEYFESTDFWVVNTLLSPVIELTKSYYNGQILRRGRLYFMAGFFDVQGNWVTKGTAFEKWGDKLLRWIRKNYQRHPENHFYFGEHAWEWHKGNQGAIGVL